ncbi:MAG TPA: hypothetical protein VJN96_05770 [Vicinamibacterales bacterium]|nr:hypothetical protein [Vicinamibacterales bacterium]
MKTRVAALLVAAGLIAGPAAVAQDADSSAIMRVFLKDGQTLPSFGETAQVADRLVFTLVIGALGSSPQYQLVSLPIALVDVEKTSRYGETVRAARYAATRGEADYSAMTADVSRALEDLAKTEDPKARLLIAERARQRLVEWSKNSYGYRAADAQELTNLFDQVIAELRAAAGESKFSVDLSMGPTAPPREPLIAPPTERETLQAALAVAKATDDAAEREGVLSAALVATEKITGLDDLRAEIGVKLAEERAADAAYAALAADVQAKADVAVSRGDVKALLSLQATVQAKDASLGARRPNELESLMKSLEGKLDLARAKRLSLDHYAMMRGPMLAYERRARPALSALDGLKPIFEAIRDMTGPGFEWLVRADGRLKTLVPLMKEMEVPDDLSDVHATLTSAITMAAEACARRKLAVAANDMPLAREASAAAAGALMLAAQARQELLARLYPPKIQ